MKHIITITDKDITGSDTLSSAKPRIAVNAVLFDADSNIALSYMGKFDLHTLPGGGVEFGENLHEAVKREMWEETGCDCEIIDELGQIIENRAEIDFAQERYYYIAQVLGKKGVLHLTDEEIAEDTTVVWVSSEQALDIISKGQHDNYQRKFLQKRDIAALTEALIWMYTRDILNRDTFAKIEPIHKGLSDDKKYYIENADGQRMFLRVSDIKEHDRKKAEYDMMECVYTHGVPTSQPLGFGICNSGKSVYSLSGLLDGEDAEIVLPSMSETEQYILGLKAGKMLRKIHALPAPEETEPWSIKFGRKVQNLVDKYNSKSKAHSDIGEVLVCYLENHHNVIDSRLQTFIHGDYNTENIIVTPDGEISVIDLNSYNGSYGDPWFDLDNMAWMPIMYPHFYSGYIKGYFNGAPPADFWNVFTYYLAYDALAALTDPYGVNGIEDGTDIVNNILNWTNDFKSHVPTWYLKDFCTEE